MVNVQTLKGFRDFLPSQVRKREYVLNILKKVFESYGFQPLETPALEYEELLTGKYGAEGDKLMYKFVDNGERKVALRYDQTVPLARVITQYQNELTLPFKRYQIQNVWRADNPQKGRYREFLQVDGDIVGAYSPSSDAEIIAIVIKSLQNLGFKKYKILINDRMLFANLPNLGICDKDISAFIKAIDKLKKIGKEKVIEELTKNGIAKEKAEYLLGTLESEKPTQRISDIFLALDKLNIDMKSVEFLPNLARGLDYYTGMIFEVEIEDYDAGSIAGGGRYDNLIGLFGGKDIPAVGFAFGFDRVIEAMENLDLFPKNLNKNNVFIAFSTAELQDKAIKITSELRDKDINAEYYLGDTNLEKQLKYADKKQIPYSIVVLENELNFKDMQQRTQETLSLEEIIKKLKN